MKQLPLMLCPARQAFERTDKMNGEYTTPKWRGYFLQVVHDLTERGDFERLRFDVVQNARQNGSGNTSAETPCRRRRTSKYVA